MSVEKVFRVNIQGYKYHLTRDEAEVLYDGLKQALGKEAVLSDTPEKNSDIKRKRTDPFNPYDDPFWYPRTVYPPAPDYTITCSSK